MAVQLPVTQFLQEAKRVSEERRDPTLYLQCLVKYWEYEHQCAPSGWARRYCLRMRSGAIAALRLVKHDQLSDANYPHTAMPILEANNERVF